MAKHRAVPDRRRWRQPPATPMTSAPRPPGIEVVCAGTKLAHLVSPDKLLADRRRGNYEAFCGARFPAASLVEPGRGRCQPCCEHLS
ncbi:MAG TPA: hypothetical protein VFO16_09500 [Pseudonocardiaceae bacterium]|nr:hypothetical protein [Pseudonocardiaceae bacterium]